mmetsp:Transcript_44737/g.107982  ORF Transcript_44737/g.107982 Transcript_44737/m.107982 type:complete len:91 (-) Transcript_44737:2155-2427(-)
MRMKMSHVIMCALVVLTPFVMGVSGETSLKVPRGQLTFDALGDDDPSSTSFSGSLHFENSGVSIGRGYEVSDMDENLLDFELRRAKMELR